MKNILTILLALSLAACSLLPGKIDETKGWSAQKLYSEARSQLHDGNYDQAIKYYQKLEGRYPYGRFAQQGQLEIAYAYYKFEEPEQAVAACERFIKQHPNHPNVDYAYYLKGVINFNDNLGILGSLSGQKMSARDPKASREAFDAFKELVTRFPNSRYTPDATLRMKYLLNALAQHEVNVAVYYYKRGAYVAAVNRTQYALKTYPQAPANEEGLAVAVRAYQAMHMTKLADDTKRVLLKNFPHTKYLADGFDKHYSWWQIWDWGSGSGY
ncbi:MAG TPA: outer membrane protein assembly factor BamD [Burkholderiales bacterium]|jgi:outer membrane protein assembly factor BamD|nr:outer membrane protein assembly factor BamD [Burkholderiales bacterium]